MNKEKTKIYRKAYYKANKEQINAQSAAWRKNNPEKKKAYLKVWAKANAEKCRAAAKAYRDANLEKAKLREAAYRKAHPEKHRARSKAYRKANLEKVKVTRKIYRALKYTSQVEAINEKVVFMRDGWKCQHCMKNVDKRLKRPNLMSASLDHIVPLSKGGTHIYANVQLAHLACKFSKNVNVLPQGEQLRIF